MKELTAKFDELVAYLRARNPIVQAYLAMAERNFGGEEGGGEEGGDEAGAAAQVATAEERQPAQAVPIVPAAALGPGIAATQVGRPVGSWQLHAPPLHCEPWHLQPTGLRRREA